MPYCAKFSRDCGYSARCPVARGSAANPTSAGGEFGERESTVAQYDAGVRKVFKWDDVPAGDLAETLAWTRARLRRPSVAGHFTKTPGDDSKAVVVFATDAAVFRTHLMAEHLPSDMARVRAIGTMFGYPECCREHYVRVASGEPGEWRDTEKVDRLFPPIGSECPLLGDRYPLVAHYPCSPSCPRTLAIAEAVLHSAAKSHPWLPGAIFGDA